MIGVINMMLGPLRNRPLRMSSHLDVNHQCIDAEIVTSVRKIAKRKQANAEVAPIPSYMPTISCAAAVAFV